MSTKKSTSIEIDLCCVLMAPSRQMHTLLTCAELDGITLICRSWLPLGTARTALEEVALLHFFDEIVLDADVSETSTFCVLVLSDPETASYKHIARDLARSRPRAVHLTF